MAASGFVEHAYRISGTFEGGSIYVLESAGNCFEPP